MESEKRFFKEGTPSTRLKLIKSKTFNVGAIALTYQLDGKNCNMNIPILIDEANCDERGIKQTYEKRTG